MLNAVTELWNVYVWGPISADPWWEMTAFIGEAIFGGRFILQWLVSEFRKKSHIPIAFWYMSVIGSAILVAYFIHRKQPVMIAAFSVQILIYIRNLWLISKEKRLAVIEAEDVVNKKENT